MVGSGLERAGHGQIGPSQKDGQRHLALSLPSHEREPEGRNIIPEDQNHLFGHGNHEGNGHEMARYPQRGGIYCHDKHRTMPFDPNKQMEDAGRVRYEAEGATDVLPQR